MVESASRWAQQAVGEPELSCPTIPGVRPHPALASCNGCAEQGVSRSTWREGRRQEEGNNPIVIPQITGWDGRGGGGKPTLFT